MSAPKIGDKIRLTNLDKISKSCGYLPGDEAIITGIIADNLADELVYEVKFTKLQDQACHDYHIESHDEEIDDVFFRDEFEVIDEPSATDR